MGFFDIDFDALTWRNIPTALRKVKLYAWLKVLTAPVKYVYVLFTGNRNANLYRLAHNSQVPKMEAVLNDTFDPVSRGIYIADPNYVDAEYLYLVAEAPTHQPIFLGTSYLPLESEISEATRFIVMVPTVVAAAPGYDVNRLRALVDQYRLAGQNNYSIQTF